MDSLATLCDRDQLPAKEGDSMFPAKKHSSRRTASFSSSSSFSSCSSSYFADDSPLSPATPLRFSGVPFSWEHLPGIPKDKQGQKKKDSALKVLPLPPPATKPSLTRFYSEESAAHKKVYNESFGRDDPFFAALVECSKDDVDDQESSNHSFWSGPKVSRSISDRFGFVNLYTSCKRTCSVSESIVYIPRPRRTSYDLINRQLGRPYHHHPR